MLRLSSRFPCGPALSSCAQDKASSRAPRAFVATLVKSWHKNKAQAGHVSHLLVCFKNMYLIYTRSLVRSAPLAQTTAGTWCAPLPPSSRLLLPSCWSSCISRKKKKKATLDAKEWGLACPCPRPRCPMSLAAVTSQPQAPVSRLLGCPHARNHSLLPASWAGSPAAS